MSCLGCEHSAFACGHIDSLWVIPSPVRVANSDNYSENKQNWVQGCHILFCGFWGRQSNMRRYMPALSGSPGEGLATYTTKAFRMLLILTNTLPKEPRAVTGAGGWNQAIVSNTLFKFLLLSWSVYESLSQLRWFFFLAQLLLEDCSIPLLLKTVRNFLLISWSYAEPEVMQTKFWLLKFSSAVNIILV